MMLKNFFAVLIVACWTVQVLQAAATDDVHSEWEKHKVKHSKSFNSASEETKRKSHFSKTHDMIKKHNSNPNSTFQMDHNKFSDMTDEEKAAHTGQVPDIKPKATRYVSIQDSTRAATSVDLRNDTCMQAIKDQGQCGSCWAFASTAVVEFNSCVKSGKKVALSEQQLVDCVTAIPSPYGGCNGGNSYYAWQYISTAVGQDTQASYPYTSSAGVKGTCKYNATNVAAKLSTTAYYSQIAANDVTTMTNILSSRALLSVSICVTNPFYSYKSGVFTDTTCGTSATNHAVVIVGYGTLNGVNYWVIRNSWGTGWGLAGYVLFQRGTNLCGVEGAALYTTVA